MKHLKLLLISSLLLVSACASTRNANEYALEYTTEQRAQVVEDSKLYQLYIDKNGILLNPDSQDPVKDEKKYIDKIIENYENTKIDNSDLVLTVFIHGGLNTFDSATRRVAERKDDMLADGKYPLFISWNSAPISNYKDHLLYLRRGHKSRLLGPLSSPFIFLEDAFRSIARIPASTYDIFFGQNIIPKSSYRKEKAEAAVKRGSLSNDIDINDNPGNVKLGFKDWATVWNPVKLVTAPFLDGLGSGAWDSMLRRSDLVLRKDAGPKGDNSQGAPTAVAIFFREFYGHSPASPIDIIGHSMGAIVANNIISKYPELEFKNIVYMAAACRIKDIEYVVSPYLEVNPETHFYNLSLHPYRDISENVAKDFLPRGSLLMWIDQTFGGPNSFADRTAGYWFNIIRAADNIFTKPEVRRRIHLTQFGVNGGPQKHGDFNDAKYEFWDKDFWLGNAVTR